MKAILRTRCGCTREMEIQYPPEEEIWIPLEKDTSLRDFYADISTFSVPRSREFRLQEVRGDFTQAAYYLEHLT